MDLGDVPRFDAGQIFYSYNSMILKLCHNTRIWQVDEAIPNIHLCVYELYEKS